LGIMIVAGLVIWNNLKRHKDRAKETEEAQVFNLKKINDSHMAISSTFDHLAHLLGAIRESFDLTFDALFDQDIDELKKQRKKVKQIQLWTNIIMANIFKVLRLQQKGDAKISYKYAQTIRRLQKISDGHRDIVVRSYKHIGNKHKGLLDVQIEELKKIKICIMDIILKAETSFNRQEIVDYQNIVDQYRYMRELADQFNQNQIERIRTDTSKTRLSILYYAIVGNCIMMSKQNIKLLEIFNESFKFDKKLSSAYYKIDSQ
jgi:Na+/phosphate symporter